MKKGTLIVGAIVVLLVAFFAFYMIDVDVTQEAELPDVDVSVEGGQMPEVDADVGSIEVGTETEQVTVPDVDVSVESEEVDVEVPSIDVQPAGE
ncbi:hypothetical protein [Litorisediminicola beolgyonensis]|uniref:Uncharacterized protein n=1 Tax=Litorisediminicola beolgyonensis TaxID=1173614 RepID=A0ABW3ZD72_9RHOB